VKKVKTDIFFREAFKKLLKKSGWGTQRKMAEEIKASAQHINDILRGRKNAGKAMMENIANFFNLSLEQMLAMGREIVESTAPIFPYSSEADEKGYLPHTLKRVKFIWMKAKKEVFGDKDVAWLFYGVLDEKIESYIKGDIDDGEFWEFALREWKKVKEQLDRELRKGKEDEEMERAWQALLKKGEEE